MYFFIHEQSISERGGKNRQFIDVGLKKVDSFMLKVFFGERFHHFFSKCRKSRVSFSPFSKYRTSYPVKFSTLVFASSCFVIHIIAKRSEKNCSNQFMFCVYWIFFHKNEGMSEIYTQLLPAWVIIICLMYLVFN